jgi:hypothetical protein
MASCGMAALLIKLLSLRGVTLHMLSTIAASGFAHNLSGRERVDKPIALGDKLVPCTNQDGHTLFCPYPDCVVPPY